MKKYVIYNFKEKAFIKALTISNDGIQFIFDEDVRNAMDLRDKSKAHALCQFIAMNGGLGFKIWVYGEENDCI